MSISLDSYEADETTLFRRAIFKGPVSIRLGNLIFNGSNCESINVNRNLYMRNSNCIKLLWAGRGVWAADSFVAGSISSDGPIVLQDCRVREVIGGSTIRIGKTTASSVVAVSNLVVESCSEIKSLATLEGVTINHSVILENVEAKHVVSIFHSKIIGTLTCNETYLRLRESNIGVIKIEGPLKDCYGNDTKECFIDIFNSTVVKIQTEFKCTIFLYGNSKVGTFPKGAKILHSRMEL